MNNGKRILQVLGALLGTLLGTSLGGCATSDFDYDGLPENVRIESDPPGVDLQLSGYVTKFVTPCDIKRDTLRGRTLTFTKAGHIPFQGTLGELSAGDRGVFSVTLRKL